MQPVHSACSRMHVCSRNCSAKGHQAARAADRYVWRAERMTPVKNLSFSFFNKKSRSVVGLDIGSSAVKAVELKPSGKGYRVAAFASEPVPPDSIVDGAIIDSAAVADAIKRVFQSKAFK